jgi:hypothetical protein
MGSVATKRAMATVLAGAAIASALCAPAVSAVPAEQFVPDATSDTSSSSVPPPPSSIAASAAEEYEDLRSAGATPTASQPVVDESQPSEGFDLPSAAIGAAAGTGLVLIVLAAGGVARRRPHDAVRT